MIVIDFEEAAVVKKCKLPEPPPGSGALYNWLADAAEGPSFEMDGNRDGFDKG